MGDGPWRGTLDGPDAQALVHAALAKIRSTIEAEADGPAEPISEHWVTAEVLHHLWMGRHVRRHFSDARYAVHTFDLDDLYGLAISLFMDEDFNEFDERELVQLDRCCVRMFDDPFARLRFHRAHMPTQERNAICRNWERFRTEVLDAR